MYPSFSRKGNLRLLESPVPFLAPQKISLFCVCYVLFYLFCSYAYIDIYENILVCNCKRGRICGGDEFLWFLQYQKQYCLSSCLWVYVHNYFSWYLLCSLLSYLYTITHLDIMHFKELLPNHTRSALEGNQKTCLAWKNYFGACDSLLHQA